MQFKEIANLTYIFPDGTDCTSSAVCNDDGAYEITITGTGGKACALRALKGLYDDLSCGDEYEDG